MTETVRRRAHVNELLVETFNSILRVEENVVRNRLTEGLTISEVHAIHAIGLHGSSPMNAIAARLDVTLATCTAAVGKLVAKGFAERIAYGRSRHGHAFHVAVLEFFFQFGDP